MKEDLFIECNKIQSDRQEQWKDTYKLIQNISEPVIGKQISTQEYLQIMMISKLIRWSKSGYTKTDCLVDLVNYARLAYNEVL